MRALERSPVVLVTHPDPYKLQAMLKRERERRAMIPRTPVSEVEPGVYGCWVTQLKPYRAPWVVPVWAAVGVTGVLAAAGVCGWYLVGLAVSAISVSTLLGMAAVVLVVRLATRSRGCEVTVTVRHRH